MIKYTTKIGKESPLAGMYKKATQHFIYGIDPNIHINAYTGSHSNGFAETEFAGKYLDTCVQYCRYMKSIGHKREYETALANAHAVANSVIKNQRSDGYIGGYAEGQETTSFSVWNQAFTLLGMLSYYGLTQDEKALTSVEKIADYNARLFMNRADILSGGNNGSQHLSFLLPLVRLCRVSDNPLYRDFTLHIVNKIKGSDNNFFDFKSILDLRSKKGIENFVILIGILEYGELFNDKAAIESCQRYWDELAATQIRENGNGTVHEIWVENGNKPQLLGLDVRPDENCVAVGWVEFNLSLFWRTGKAKYIDAVERSLYNHLLGAIDDNGEDFAYYQPNYGRRVTRTAESMYKCCRYRGFSAVSHLTDMLFYAKGETVIPLVYTDAEYEDDFIKLTEESDYPYGGGVCFAIEFKRKCRRVLRLRVPECVRSVNAAIDGSEIHCDVVDGYFNVDITSDIGSHVINLAFDIGITIKRAEINGERRVNYSYGCILLAAETSDGLDTLYINSNIQPERAETTYEKIEFHIGDIRLVNYSSSGRTMEFEYTVWIREKRT